MNPLREQIVSSQARVSSDDDVVNRFQSANVLVSAVSGGRGIRTHGAGVTDTAVFKIQKLVTSRVSPSHDSAPLQVTRVISAAQGCLKTPRFTETVSST